LDNQTAQTLWENACVHLRELLHPDIYTRWIAVIEPCALEDHRLVLSVDNDFYQTWLEENYLPLIRTALSAVSGEEYDIEFTIEERRSTDATAVDDAQKKKSIRERISSRWSRSEPPLKAELTFEEFIVGPSNSFAHGAALAVAQAPSRAYNPLFIYGGVGLGKTHLMHAIGHSVYAKTRAPIAYLSCETFTNEYIDALQNRSLVQFRKRYRTVDVLLIDDIHFLAGKERLQEEFFHTFNALTDARKQIVMTSDRPAREIPGLEQRLVSRFEWGLVTELEAPDLETRIAILRNKMEQTSLSLPDEVVYYIAEHIASNIRRLEGALIRVTSYASLTGKELSADLVERLLRDSVDEEQQQVLSFDKIQRAVAEHFDVRLADMTSKRRPQAIAVPRQVAMYLCRRLTPSSLPEIGNAFCKTHATVLHAFRTIEKKMASDAALKQSVVTISKKIGSPL
tara:strand:- start:4001 stop:5362 length:1362 start_codon:yes stop_codon:yes gene_type:complete